MSSETYILAIDQGTTSTRSVLVGTDGSVQASSQLEFTQYFPEPGWVEHDAEEIWQSVLHTAREAMESASVSAEQIAGIGIVNQRETVVVWDRESGTPVYPAIVWQSRQSDEICQRLKDADKEDLVRSKTGLCLDPYFSASKVSWLLEQKPELRSRASAGELCLGTIDSWLLFKLTGGAVHATDVTNASRTLLFDLSTGGWSEELCNLFNIPSEMLPEIRPNACLFGHTLSDHLGAEVPITGMAGDQHAALFGQHCIEQGEVKCTYGTGAFVLMNTGAEIVASEAGLLTTVAWEVAGTKSFALEGSVFMAGAAAAWLRDQLEIVENIGELEPLARSVDSTDGVMVVPAFVGLGAPYWESKARGAILGLTRGSSKAHVARAMLEAIALQIGVLVTTMQRDSGVELTSMKVDGGASLNELLLEMQASLLGVPVQRPSYVETTVSGAARFAMLGAGVVDSVESLPLVGEFEFTAQPDMEEEVRTSLLARWDRAIKAVCSF